MARRSHGRQGLEARPKWTQGGHRPTWHTHGGQSLEARPRRTWRTSFGAAGKADTRRTHGGQKARRTHYRQERRGQRGHKAGQKVDIIDIWRAKFGNAAIADLRQTGHKADKLRDAARSRPTYFF